MEDRSKETMNDYYYVSPVGVLHIRSDAFGVCELKPMADNSFEDCCHGKPSMPDGDIGDAVRWLEVYFSGHNPQFMPRLHLVGTPFQRSVWDCLLALPYGETITYGGLARMLGRPLSAQAVGQAVARNPVAVIVPCHRVVGSDGRLTGYAYGLEMKRRLIAMEAGIGV